MIMPAEFMAAVPSLSSFQAEPSPEHQPPAWSSVADTPFIQYLLEFWTSESGYAKYKSGVKKRPLSAYYIAMNHDDVARHIAPFPGFAQARLGAITRKLIKEWLIWMSDRKVKRRRKDGTIVEGSQLSGRRINAILQGMRVAVRWAIDNEDLAVDPFRKLDETAEESKEKGMLTPAELKKLIALSRFPISFPGLRSSLPPDAVCAGAKSGDSNGETSKRGLLPSSIILLMPTASNPPRSKAEPW
jgi:hypothetical protein